MITTRRPLFKHIKVQMHTLGMLSIHTDLLLHRLDHMLLFLSRDQTTPKIEWEKMVQWVNATLKKIQRYNPRFEIDTVSAKTDEKGTSHKISFNKAHVLNVLQDNASNTISITRKTSYMFGILNKKDIHEIVTFNTQNYESFSDETVYNLIGEGLKPSYSIRQFKDVALRLLVFTHFERIIQFYSRFYVEYHESQLPQSRVSWARTIAQGIYSADKPDMIIAIGKKNKVNVIIKDSQIIFRLIDDNSREKALHESEITARNLTNSAAETILYCAFLDVCEGGKEWKRSNLDFFLEKRHSRTNDQHFEFYHLHPITNYIKEYNKQLKEEEEIWKKNNANQNLADTKLIERQQAIDQYISTHDAELDNEWNEENIKINKYKWKRQQAENHLPAKEPITAEEINDYIQRNTTDMQKLWNETYKSQAESRIKSKLIYNSSRFTDRFTSKHELTYPFPADPTTPRRIETTFLPTQEYLIPK